MKILVIGKKGYVSTCFQTYMQKNYGSIQVNAISARNDAWKSVDFRGYDAVFNTTGLAHNNARKGTEEEFILLNTYLPFDLAKKAKDEGVSEFVNMSSMIVYGDMTSIGLNERITETTIPKPANIYGESKLKGEENIIQLSDNNFHVAIIRSPLVYSETAVDNFLLMTNLAEKLPFFPYVKNERSMIYSDNLCELVRLIIENKSSGFFYPQQEVYICTSEIMKEIANQIGHRIWMPSFLTPMLKLLSRRSKYIRKVFGNLAYEMDISNHFNGSYRIVGYPESVRRIVEMKKNN